MAVLDRAIPNVELMTFPDFSSLPTNAPKHGRSFSPPLVYPEIREVKTKYLKITLVLTNAGFWPIHSNKNQENHSTGRTQLKSGDSAIQ